MFTYWHHIISDVGLEVQSDMYSNTHIGYTLLSKHDWWMNCDVFLQVLHIYHKWLWSRIQVSAATCVWCKVGGETGRIKDRYDVQLGNRQKYVIDR